MISKAETVMRALAEALRAGMPPGVRFSRGEPLPVVIPPGGVVTLHDGEPGEPVVLMSPLTYLYEHRAEVDLVVDRAQVRDPEAALDAIRVAIGTAIAADRTLGGLCDYVLGVAPANETFVIDGAVGLTAASVGIVLTYGSPDPLL